MHSQKHEEFNFPSKVSDEEMFIYKFGTKMLADFKSMLSIDFSKSLLRVAFLNAKSLNE